MAGNHSSKRRIVIEPLRRCVPKIPDQAAHRETPPRGTLNGEQRESLGRLTALLRLLSKDPTISWRGKPGRN